MTREEQEVAGLRAAFAQPDGAPSPDDCPPPERLWAAAAGELGPAEIREVVEHMALCSACAEEWRLAVAVAGERESKEPVPRPKRWAGWAGALAAGLFLGAFGLRLYDSRHLQRPSETRGEHVAIELLVADGATLDRQDLRLAWRAVTGARSYELEIQDASGAVLVRQEGLIPPEARVPAAGASALPSSTPLYWRVTAHLSTGASIDSESRSFLLR